MNAVQLVLIIGILQSASAGVGEKNISENKTDGVGIISPRSEAKDETSSETNDEKECNCTPFNLCKSFVATEDGGNRINIRTNMAPPCQSYMDVCCDDNEKLSLDEKHDSDKKNESKNDHDSDKKDDSEKKQDSEKKHDSDTKHDLDKNNDSENSHDLDKKYDSDKKDNADKKDESDKKNDSNKKNDSDKKGDTDKKLTCECKVPEYEEHTEKSDDKYEDHSVKVTKPPHKESPDEDKRFTSEDHTIKSVIEYKEDPHKEPACGQWNKDGVGFRVVNAIDGESQFGEYPSMVAIFVEENPNGDLKHLVHCGGSLIKKNVVLTAAHCVIKKNIAQLVVRAGDWDLKTDKEVYLHQDRRVSKVVTHPHYHAGGLHSDVALIFTDDAFYLQENVQTICLPKQDEHFHDDRCFSCGWGKTVSYNNYTIYKKDKSGSSHEVGKYEVNILKKVEVPVVNREKCMAALRRTRLGPKFILHDSFMCAGGEEGKDTCRGDGGGPLMCPSKDDPTHLIQAGIVSWGIQCGLVDIPGVYVDVASFRNWIDQEIETYKMSLSKEPTKEYIN